MIVNYNESGWQIITQRSHGLLSAQICAHWRKDKQPVRWVDTLIATAEHDDVYNEFDNPDLIGDNGGPINFKTRDFEKEYAVRLITLAETKSAYVALLVAKHIRFVHGADPKAKAFMRTLNDLEQKWLNSAEIENAEIDKAYQLLEFCDAFSLLICQGLVQPEGRKVEISSGPDGQPYEMFAQGDGVAVQPWPFEIDSFLVTYESRTLPELKFRNSAHFRTAIEKASAHTHHLKISRQ